MTKMDILKSKEILEQIFGYLVHREEIFESLVTKSDHLQSIVTLGSVSTFWRNVLISLPTRTVYETRHHCCSRDGCNHEISYELHSPSKTIQLDDKCDCSIESLYGDILYRDMRSRGFEIDVNCIMTTESESGESESGESGIFDRLVDQS